MAFLFTYFSYPPLNPLPRGDFSHSPLERGWGCVDLLLNKKRLSFLYIINKIPYIIGLRYQRRSNCFLQRSQASADIRSKMNP